MTQHKVWFCQRCGVVPPLDQLVAPEPPMHSVCSSTCMRTVYDDTNTGGRPQPPPGKSAREELVAACAEPPKPKPPTLG